MAKPKKYKLIPLKDRLVTTPTALASLAVLGGGLSLAFNPVALGVAGGVVAYTQVMGGLLSIPAFRNWVFNGLVKKGRWQPVPEDTEIAQITAEISQRLGRKTPPKIYLIGANTVAQMSLPFGMRWMMTQNRDVMRQAMCSTFFALPGTNTILTTRLALLNGLSEKQLRFIAAHEMMHLQAKDNRSPSLKMEVTIKKATRVLFWGTLAAAGLAVAGISAPIVLGNGIAGAAVAMGVLAGTRIAANMLNNMGMRTIENRADRNALYITRDLESGTSALKAVTHAAGRKKPNFFQERLRSHPSYDIRAKIMTKAFNKVAKYPELPASQQKAAPTAKADALSAA